MYDFKENRISKKDFLKLNEDDVLFITNPGRMGDEDGSTFVIKKENEFICYRVDGWMYRSQDKNQEEMISMSDTAKQFPTWFETWKNWNNENYKGKYKYLYMGFGNGLSVDKSIYDEFKPYLEKEKEKYFESYSEEDRKDLQYAVIVNVWDKALIQMAKDKKIVIK